MTTVGYGDFFPRTLPGRILTFVLSIWGTLVISLMCVALSSYVNLAKNEAKAFYMIRMVRIKNEELNSALNLITSALNFKHKTKNSNNNWLKKLMLNISLIKLREKFLNLRGARKAV
jgi:Ion channel